MRIRNLIISLLLLACARAQAKPARPGLVRHTQPDGSVMLLRLQGDERGHYALDQEGRVLELDALGFYRLSSTPESALRRRITRRPQARNSRTVPPPTLHIAVILVEFQDVGFSLSQPLRHFEHLLSQPGYGEDGATGSVCDFYRDNSGGQFDPQFEVFGPVRLSRKRSYYGAGQSGGEDLGAEKAFLEACRLADAQIDFSRFDEDGDGIIDQLVFFFAGHDQAEGGPTEAFWSHHGNFAESSETSVSQERLDGLAPGEYICTAELQGSEGVRPMGIGSTCHELAHSLGLPDFYDVDGNQDGLAGGLYQFSTMSMGLYNNDGRTPPHFNAVERRLLGWLAPEDILPLPKDGHITIVPVQENKAYMSRTDTEGEFFIYECRNGEEWDAPLPQGLVIYHIDQSQRPVGGDLPASVLWEDWRVYNNLNSRGKHPCFYLVPAMETSSLNYPGALSMPGNLIFPGNGRVFAFEPMDWDYAPSGVQLVCLSYADGTSSARVLRKEGRYLCGEIHDPEGRPVASVTLSVNGSPTALSNPEGFFLFSLGDDTPDDFLLTAAKAGYRPFNMDVSLGGQRFGCQPLTLLQEDDPASNALSHWDRTLSRGYYPTDQAAIGAVRLTPEELAPFAMQRLSQIICYPYVGEVSGGRLFVTVDIDGERVLTRAVSGSAFMPYEPVQVDISDADIRIPEGRTIYIGYGFENGCPLGVVYPSNPGNSFWKPFADVQAPWREIYSDISGYYMDVMVEGVVTEVPGETLDQMGYAYIDPGSGTPLDGETFLLKLHLPAGEAPDVRWTYDGEPVSGTSILLSAGEHILQALLTYPGGRSETLQMDFSI